MGMKLTLTNLFTFFGSISPALLTFFLLMVSLFNQNAKGFVYIGGILIATVANVLLANMFGKSPPETANPLSCSLIDFPGDTYYSAPAYNTMFIAFTIMYLVLPMVFNNNMNYFLMIFLVIILCSEVFSKLLRGCNDMIDILSGIIFGSLMGFMWFALLHYTGNNSLLFYSDFVSNKVVCERPKRQQFKCAVYKNGKLLKELD